MSQTQAIAANVKGRVHGVGFRYTTQSRARELGLAGWVRNERDGSVTVWAQGDAAAIEQLTSFLEAGPAAARVSAAAITAVEPDPKITTFVVRY